MITQEYLKSILDYNAKTGVFKWKKNSRRVSPGDIAGHKNKKLGYITIRILEKNLYAHRLAWLYSYGRYPIGVTDHKNRDRSDNRLINLREASRNQNNCNKDIRSNLVGFRGVAFIKACNKFKAQIKSKGKSKHLGHFKTAEEAHEAYCKAAKELHGEFANFD